MTATPKRIDNISVCEAQAIFEALKSDATARLHGEEGMAPEAVFELAHMGWRLLEDLPDVPAAAEKVQS